MNETRKTVANSDCEALMLSRCAAEWEAGKVGTTMLRSVDGGGEVDLDKRAITGDDDIIELDQLPTQHTDPPSAHHDSHPTPARQPST